jgi:hypothetical protein
VEEETETVKQSVFELWQKAKDLSDKKRRSSLVDTEVACEGQLFFDLQKSPRKIDKTSSAKKEILRDLKDFDVNDNSKRSSAINLNRST